MDFDESFSCLSVLEVNSLNGSISVLIEPTLIVLIRFNYTISLDSGKLYGATGFGCFNSISMHSLIREDYIDRFVRLFNFLASFGFDSVLDFRVTRSSCFASN